jgi:hypothetical protein
MPVVKLVPLAVSAAQLLLLLLPVLLPAQQLSMLLQRLKQAVAAIIA